MIKQPKTIMIGPGMCACFDEQGEQMAELQCSWIIVLLERWEKKGVDILNVRIEMYMNGVMVLLKPFRTDYGGWNYDVVPFSPDETPP